MLFQQWQFVVFRFQTVETVENHPVAGEGKLIVPLLVTAHPPKQFLEWRPFMATSRIRREWTRCYDRGVVRVRMKPDSHSFDGPDEQVRRFGFVHRWI